MAKPRKHFLYRQFDRYGRLLYVGVSISALARHMQHSTTSHWSNQIVRVEIERFRTAAAALAAETAAIIKERPRYNKMIVANASGGRPRLEDRDKTLKATKPWAALGMSERTWYRRQAEKRKAAR